MAMNVIVDDEQIIEKYREISMFTLADSHRGCDYLWLGSECPHDCLERGTRVRSIEDVRLRLTGRCRH